jgi:hypothetical protein
MTTINKQIAASLDDCHESNDTDLHNTTVAHCGRIAGNKYDIGLRWQSVNIANAASITSATLSCYLDTDGGTLSANIRGIDEDNTAAWSAGSRPSQRTKTTATITANEANWGNWGVGNWITINVTSAIQEIIDRAGWAANNALGIVIEDTAGAGTDYASIRAYDYAGNVSGAKLDIVYTGTSIPVMLHQLKQQGIS